MSRNDTELLAISVLSGESDYRSIYLVPGKPVEAFSVGLESRWKVLAEGVGPQHVHLSFDGRDVYASSTQSALLAGVPLVGGRWTRVTPPCELRFGGACIIIRRARRPASPDGDPSTVNDGGALYEAAKLAVAAAMRGPPPSLRNGATLSTLIDTKPSDGPAATERMPNAPSRPAGARGNTLPKNPGDSAQRRPLPSGAAGRAVRFWNAEPVTLDTKRSSPTVVDAPSDVPIPLPKTPAAAAAAVGAKKDAKAIWASAPLVRKATWVLLPLAALASFVLVQDPKLRARDAAAKAAANAPGARAGDAAVPAMVRRDDPGASPDAHPPLPSTTLSDRAAASAESAKAVVPGARFEPPPATGTGGRTPEREALDTVAAGSFDEAATRYDALAAAHPDDVAFPVAARVLHEKAAHGH